MAVQFKSGRGVAALASIAGMVAGLGGLTVEAAAQCLTPKWVRLQPLNSPPSRYASAFAFDRNAGIAVMYGGIGANGTLGDTWTWDGSNWTQRNPSLAQDLGPQRNGAAGFSSFYGSVVMHGGLTANGTPSSAAYRFNPVGQGSWLPMSSQVGAPRYNHTLTDTGTSMVIGGGIVSPCNTGSAGILVRTTDFFTTSNLTDQWEVQTHGAFYRAAGDRLRLVAGSVINGCNTTQNSGTNDAAVFPNVNGTQQTRTLEAYPFSARNNIGMADNFESDQVALFGGALLNNFPGAPGVLGDTWLRNSAGVWSQLSVPAGTGPSPRRAYNAMVYDSVRNQFVLFGGHNGEVMGDTWVLTYAPAIILQPIIEVPAFVGGAAVMSVSVDGPGTLLYQWRRNGQPLSNGVSGNGSAYLGVNTRVLQISGVTWDDDATYDVVVTNDCGSVTSRSFRLPVSAPACYANCDGSQVQPVLNALDFACFLNRFRQGCP